MPLKVILIFPPLIFSPIWNKHFLQMSDNKSFKAFFLIVYEVVCLFGKSIFYSVLYLGELFKIIWASQSVTSGDFAFLKLDLSFFVVFHRNHVINFSFVTIKKWILFLSIILCCCGLVLNRNFGVFLFLFQHKLVPFWFGKKIKFFCWGFPPDFFL